MEIEEYTNNKKTARLSSRQLDTMISYMEANPDLRENKANSHLSKAERKRKWHELADILNAEGWSGAVKTPDQWRKCWNDQKGYARTKALRTRKLCQTANANGSAPYEILTPMEERLLRVVGCESILEEAKVTPSNTAPYISNVEVPMFEEAVEGFEEESVLPIKEEIHSDESTTIEESIICEVSPGPDLHSTPSLDETAEPKFMPVNFSQANKQPETSQSGFMAVNLNNQTSKQPETSQSGFLVINNNQPSKQPETSQSGYLVINNNQASKHPETSQSGFLVINNNQPSKQPDAAQSGFMPIILNALETEKSEEKPVSSKELSAVLENLKHQNDLLKRIAVANEQIAQACMAIANNTEERTKETSLQTELIKDINQTLKYVLKQKSKEDLIY